MTSSNAGTLRFQTQAAGSPSENGANVICNPLSSVSEMRSASFTLSHAIELMLQLLVVGAAKSEKAGVSATPCAIVVETVAAEVPTCP